MTARTFGRRGVNDGGISGPARGPARPRPGGGAGGRRGGAARGVRRRGTRPGRPRRRRDAGLSSHPRRGVGGGLGEAEIARRRLCSCGWFSAWSARTVSTSAAMSAARSRRRSASSAGPARGRILSRLRRHGAGADLGCRPTPISSAECTPGRRDERRRVRPQYRRRRLGDGRPPRRFPRRGAGPRRTAGRRSGRGWRSPRLRPGIGRESRTAPPICSGSSWAASARTVSISIGPMSGRRCHGRCLTLRQLGAASSAGSGSSDDVACAGTRLGGARRLDLRSTAVPSDSAARCTARATGGAAAAGRYP